MIQLSDSHDTEEGEVHTWGVRKNTLLSCQAISRFFTATLPVISMVSSWGIPMILKHASICWATNGLVGAMKTNLESGYHRKKLYITTAAIKVLPRPTIGKQVNFTLGTLPKKKINTYQLEAPPKYWQRDKIWRYWTGTRVSDSWWGKPIFGQHGYQILATLTRNGEWIVFEASETRMAKTSCSCGHRSRHEVPIWKYFITSKTYSDIERPEEVETSSACRRQPEVLGFDLGKVGDLGKTEVEEDGPVGV